MAVTATQIHDAQAQRLEEVARHLDVAQPTSDADSPDRIINALGALVGRICANRNDSELWLLYTAIAGAFPSEFDLKRAIEFRDSNSQDAFFDWVIPASAVAAAWGGSLAAPMRIVSSVPVVDVNHCARYDRHTGIQRVERETLPLWEKQRDIEFVVWTERSGVYRSLDNRERHRVLSWGKPPGREANTPLELVVPWQTTIVLPEIADRRQASRLRAIARYSGNRVSVIGYDVIPLTSPELLPRESGTDFLDYLAAIKHATVIAGISASAAEEFHGFIESARIPPEAAPRVVACDLPTAVPEAEREKPKPWRDVPVVLCVGSHEPRKNHSAVLFAAEKLWRDGVDFELWFLGGGGWGTDFDEQVADLKKKDRKVVVRKGVNDSVLWDAYRQARFTVFPSLHEGFGLPAAESMSFGTPVITTNYGSTREIAEVGGAIMVDPRNDDEIHDAMRLLLTDDDVWTRLCSEASAMPSRSWQEYADELWEVLVNHAHA